MSSTTGADCDIDYWPWADSSPVAAFEPCTEPRVNLSDPANPIVYFAVDGTQYDAEHFDAEVGAVALRYSATDELVLSAGFGELQEYLKSQGAAAGLIKAVVAALKANPAKD